MSKENKKNKKEKKQKKIQLADGLRGKHLLKLLDFSKDEITYLIKLAMKLKKDKKKGIIYDFLVGKNIALIFEKDSTRTRCAFEVATHDLGGTTTYLAPTGSQMGKKETIEDTARVLVRMYDGIQYRGFGQEIVETLAKHAGVTVWNGLTNEFHPTQVLADLMTMMEHCDKNVEDMVYCYTGDARFNMGNSLLVLGAKMGMDVRIAAPKEVQPDAALVAQVMEIAAESGARVTITENLEEAVKDCDFIITDVWVSMGEPAETWKQRIELLRPYQVNQEVMAMSGNKNVKFMHCLPAFHNRKTTVGEEIFQKFGLDGIEVTEDVFESEASIVFDEAENRMHTIKAVILATI